MKQPTRLFRYSPLPVGTHSNEADDDLEGAVEWKAYSTKEFIEAVDQASRALLDLGVKHGR
jgi:hypothetical protein